METKKLILLVFIFLLINFISAECSDEQINVNTASLEDLDKIIWIGSATAQNIVSSRPFETLDDLLKVSGIGEIKLADIKEQNLACVEETEDNKISQETAEEIEEEPEVIKVVENKTYEEKNITKQDIKINPKVINTEDDTSKLIKGEYALIGLAFFSILIIFLLVLKLKPRDKNEFS